jgi:cytidylate kinase
VSVYPGVRTAMTRQQREIGRRGRVVMVGRDIGTVVLPNADLKIYLDASLEVRAQRRYEEICRRGETVEFADVLKGLRDRDEIDSHRATAPLTKAEDAFYIDSDPITADQVVDLIMHQIMDR